MLIALPLLVGGVAAGYVRSELAEPDSFADRSVDALRSKEVRAVIAEQVAVELLEKRSPQLVASRPLVVAAIEAILQTGPFARVFRRTAFNAHRILFRENSDVVVELAEARTLLAPALESAAPELAREIPADLRPQIAEIRRGDAATAVVRAAEGAKVAAWPLLLSGGLLLVLAVAGAPDRRRAMAHTGAGLAGAALLGLVALSLLREQVLSHASQVGVLSDDDARTAAGATWDALAGGLEDWYLALALAGVALVGGVLVAESGVDRAAALRRVAGVLVGGHLPWHLRILRGGALAGLGTLVLLRTEPFLRLMVGLIGGALVVFGLAELVATMSRRARPGRAWPRRRARAMAGVLVAGAIAVTLLVTRSDDADPPSESEIIACNGAEALCERRLDQVVFAGTHNSMSAADRPGWFFANQTRPIPQQLSDGIRLLMIDPHYGIVDGQGRVRTDIQREGTNRNRVARRLGADAVEAAEGLAGRLGLVPSDGKREVFLCHTLCELGAERMSSTLDELRGFLERNRSEVLIVFLESSVDAADVEREFENADLEPFLATLDRDAPLPTLREMVTSGRRLIVFDERDGGEASWYQPGFSFVQDTRIRSLSRSQTACDPNRGVPENPLFLMNHWIDQFPPSPSENRVVGERAVISRRIESCERARGRRPNLIAVDFYDRSDVIETVRDLNGEPPLSGG